MKKFFILFIIMFIMIINIQGQMTMYYMDRLPQIQQYNPALFPKVKVFFGFPNISTELNNSGFNVGQFMDFYNNVGKPNYNPDDFINSIDDINKTNFEIRSNIFSFGFQLNKNNYISMGLSNRSYFNMVAPSNVVYLTGSVDDILNRLPISINDIQLDMNIFSQISLTYTRKFGDRLNIGVSPKLVGSLIGMKINSMKLEISQENYDYVYDYSGDVNVGLIKVIEDGSLYPNDVDPNWKSLIESDLFENSSLLFDIGAYYKLNNNLSFSASVLDIGNLKWKKYGYNISYNKDELPLLKSEVFKMNIPTKIFVGANYKLSNNWNVGLLFRDVIYDNDSYKSATLSMNGYIGSLLSTSVSYTYGHSFDNLGLGLRVRFLPWMDLYAVTDNIIQAFNYKNIQYASAAVGINFSFGIKNK